jgi:hypothetical protein
VLNIEESAKKIKEGALELSRAYGKGVKIEINAIANEQVQNCSIKVTLNINI